MKVFVAIGVLVIFICLTGSSAKVYTRCGLLKELERQKIERSLFSNWFCLIENESEMVTSRVTQKSDGSYSYGLLQVNSRNWCTRGRVGGRCGRRCEDFLNDDISDDLSCAKKVFDMEGFKDWSGWKRSCYNKPLANLLRC